MNVVKAAGEGLRTMEGPEAVSKRRGVSVEQIYGFTPKKEGE